MGRPRKTQTITEQIEQAEELALKRKEAYDLAVASLKELREKLEKENQKALLTAVSKSRRSYEQIMEFILSTPEENDEE